MKGLEHKCHSTKHRKEGPEESKDPELELCYFIPTENLKKCSDETFFGRAYDQIIKMVGINRFLYSTAISMEFCPMEIKHLFKGLHVVEENTFSTESVIKGVHRKWVSNIMNACYKGKDPIM